MKYFLLLFLSCAAFGIETDPFRALDQSLKDSSFKIDKHLSRSLAHVLREKNPQTCDQVIDEFTKEFRMLVYHKIEYWILKNSEIDKFPRTQEEDESSLFDDTLYAHMPLAPTINYNGVYIGTDKLGHFISMGQRYHKRYRDFILETGDHDRAVKRVIDYGVSTEEGAIGKRVSGVMSLGDLEANYQGFRFFMNLCGKHGSPVQQISNRFILMRPLDLRGYINVNMNEAINPSIYKKELFEKIYPNFLNYCSKLNSYQYVSMKQKEMLQKKSKNVAYLDSLEDYRDREAYSLEGICRDHRD